MACNCKSGRAAQRAAANKQKVAEARRAQIRAARDRASSVGAKVKTG